MYRTRLVEGNGRLAGEASFLVASYPDACTEKLQTDGDPSTSLVQRNCKRTETLALLWWTPDPSTYFGAVSDGNLFHCQVYDQNYVLWRPRAGEVAALPEACPHRGASLAMGTIVGTTKEGKCVKCPYHGLEFNKEGSCNKKNIFTDTLNVSSWERRVHFLKLSSSRS